VGGGIVGGGIVGDGIVGDGIVGGNHTVVLSKKNFIEGKAVVQMIILAF
jgi:hypothetical protein